MAPIRTRLLTRRSSNVENAPPSVLAHKLARDTHLLVRPRVVSRDHRRSRSSRTHRGVDRTKFKKNRIMTPPIHVRITPSAPSAPAPAPVATLPTIPETSLELTLPTNQTVTLDRKLRRYNFGKPIPRQNIFSIAPELADTSIHFLRDEFELFGPELELACRSVGIPSGMTTIPPTIEITLNDTERAPPTHILAVRKHPDSPGSTTGANNVTLHPVHAIIPTIYCSSFPRLVYNNVESPLTPGEQVIVPVKPIILPYPEHFSILLSYMYNKNPLPLFRYFVPAIPPAVVRDASATGTRQGQVAVYALELCRSMSWTELFRRLMALNGAVKDVWALGMSDDGLWAMMDVCWEILLTALNVSVQRVRAEQQQRAKQ
ncbi:unnamed protein product [Somion occarium]|uniref:Clp1-like protein n=1 Tax=Somion occarium TaxID=3059160 RepID=A0ABP1DQD2_9APHY